MHRQLPSAILQCLLYSSVKNLLFLYPDPGSGVYATPPLTQARRATGMGSVASSYKGRPRM